MSCALYVKHAWLWDWDLLVHTPAACLEHWLPHESSSLHLAFDRGTVLHCVLLRSCVPLAMCLRSLGMNNPRVFCKEMVNEAFLIKVP